MILSRSLSSTYLLLFGFSLLPVAVSLSNGQKVDTSLWAQIMFVVVPVSGIMVLLLGQRTKSETLGSRVRHLFTLLIPFWVLWAALLITLAVIQDN